MKHPHSRRKFMKSMLAVPLAASVPGLLNGKPYVATLLPSVSDKFGHKFKISLNVYSFNYSFLNSVYYDYYPY